MDLDTIMLSWWTPTLTQRDSSGSTGRYSPTTATQSPKPGGHGASVIGVGEARIAA
jgi:hypothetical protein